MKKKACLRTFAWLSHDRPDALRRSIRSFLNQVGPVAPTYQFIIAESGPFQSKPDFLPGKDVIYIDDSYREKLIAYLEDGLRTLGVKKDIVRFALDAHQPEGSEGVHRNAIALLTRGELFVCTDDDVLFDLRTLPASAKRQTEAGTSDFLPFKDFSELESFEAGAASVSVQEFIARQEEALQSTTFCSPGIRGDSAYGGPRFIFTFDDSSLQTFCRDQDFVSKALGSRVMWRQTAKSHIVSYASLATYMLGMNGSKGLAPCFPFGRNVDGAFVYATKALHPSAQTAQLSVSVSHRPLFDRGSYSSLRELEMRINDVIWLLWSEWLQLTPNVADVGARYRLASAHFQSLADQSLSDFRDFSSSWWVALCVIGQTSWKHKWGD